MPHPFRIKLKVYTREIMIRLRAFRFFIVAFFVVTGLSGYLIYLKYNISPIHAYYEGITLLFFASSLEYPAGDLLYELMWIIYPVFGLILLVDGLAGIGVSIKFGDVTSREWNIFMAREYENHVIVVGVGNLGERVINKLVDTSWDFIMIDKLDGSNKEDLIEEYQKNNKIPLIRGDATREYILKQANISKARAMMILIDNDLLNLKIAIKARKINPKIKIIMRMFDIEFGEEISKKLNFNLLSTSKIAVDSFISHLGNPNT